MTILLKILVNLKENEVEKEIPLTAHGESSVGHLGKRGERK